MSKCSFDILSGFCQVSVGF